MQVMFHMGVLCTDEDQLVRSLERNRDRLAAQGIDVPRPGQYRPVIGEAVRNLQSQSPNPELQVTLIDAVAMQDDPARIILSSQTFLGAAPNALVDGQLYPRATVKSQLLPKLFPEAECAFSFAIRNPATFLPALCARQSETGFEQMMAGADPRRLLWSDLVRRLREASPEVPLTIWCDEDTPVIWPEVLRAVAGLGSDAAPLEGGNDRLRELMSEAGLEKLSSYLETNPPPTPELRRRIVAAFLDKYALEDAMELELDLPGWTDELVEELTDIYEEDAGEIAGMDGVTFLSY